MKPESKTVRPAGRDLHNANAKRPPHRFNIAPFSPSTCVCHHQRFDFKPNDCAVHCQGNLHLDIDCILPHSSVYSVLIVRALFLSSCLPGESLFEQSLFRSPGSRILVQESALRSGIRNTKHFDSVRCRSRISSLLVGIGVARHAQIDSLIDDTKERLGDAQPGTDSYLGASHRIVFIGSALLPQLKSSLERRLPRTTRWPSGSGSRRCHGKRRTPVFLFLVFLFFSPRHLLSAG